MVGSFNSVNIQPPDNSGMDKALGAITQMVSQMAQMMQMMLMQMQQMQQINMAMMQKLDGQLGSAAAHGEPAASIARNDSREVDEAAYLVDDQVGARFQAAQLKKLLAKLGALPDPVAPAPVAKAPTGVNPIGPGNLPTNKPATQGAVFGPGPAPQFVAGPTPPPSPFVAGPTPPPSPFVIGPTAQASPFVVGPGPAPTPNTDIKITGK